MNPSSNDSNGPKGGPSDGRVPLDADGNRLPDGKWVESQRSQASAVGVGLQFGLVITIFALAGLWADERFDTSPWLLLGAVALAFVGSTVSLLKRFK